MLADEHHEFLRVNHPLSAAMSLVVGACLTPFTPISRIVMGVALLAIVHVIGSIALPWGRTRETAERIRFYSFINAQSGLAWGLLWWIALPAEPEAQLYVAIAIPFQMAVNMVDSSSVPASFLGFHIPFSAVVIAAFLISTTGTPRWAALVFGVMALYILVLAKVMASSARDRAELTVRNSDLIEELNEANVDLERQSTHDRLTGLANRLALERFLEEAFEDYERSDITNIVALYIDLDRFKDVNDTRGHSAGDELLVRVARRLQKLTPEDACVARIGGDEIVVVLPDRDAILEGELLAGEIVERMGQSFGLSSGPVKIGASVGVAITSKMCRTPRNLLRDADSALYQAKSTGRSHWVSFEDPSPSRARFDRAPNRSAASDVGPPEPLDHL